MLPSDVRRHVDAIWDKIWASGVSNPLTAIEYFSTLLLLARLNDTQEAGGSSSWATLQRHIDANDPPAVAALMLAVQSHFGIGASPDIASPATWRDLATLRDVMREVTTIDLTDRNHDILGDLFEYMLDHLSSAGHFGQFRTPRHLIRFIVEAVDPRHGELVLDPAAGTAGFLIAAHEHRGRSKDERYLGIEVDATIARIARTNFLMHGIDGGSIQHDDSLGDLTQNADVILANPPFAGSVISDRVAHYQNGSLKTELLFLELMIKRLKPQGRAGVVVPSGVLTGKSASATWIRRQLIEVNRISAIVELPGGVFRPYTDVKTAIILWQNSTPADDVLLIRVNADGYSLDDRREPIPLNDLPSALALIQGNEANLASARVPLREIRNNSYVLNPSRYISEGVNGPSASTAAPLSEAVVAIRSAAGSIESELRRLEGLLR